MHLLHGLLDVLHLLSPDSQYSFSFTDEEPDPERLKIFPRVTQPERKPKFKSRDAYLPVFSVIPS